MKLEIQVNKEKGEEVLGKLYSNLINKGYPFNGFLIKPQAAENLPKNLVWGSLEHARFLFFACLYMRGAIKSRDAIRRLTVIYNLYPQLFNPYSYLYNPNETEQLLYNTLLEYIGYQTYENKKFWVANALELIDCWDGDPRNIFSIVNEQTKGSDEIYFDLCHLIIRNFSDPRDGAPQKTLRGFYGFREKMASMLIYFLIDAGMIPSFPFPAPIDFHVMRTFVQHEILSYIQQTISSERLLQIGRETSLWYSNTYKVPPELLSDVVWLYSEYMCTLNPGSKAYRKVKGTKGRGTKFNYENIVWTENKLKKWSNSCGSCCVADSCKFNVPAGYYYDKGQIHKGPVQRPPEDFIERPPLFQINLNSARPKPLRIILPVKKRVYNDTFSFPKSGLFDSHK